MKSSLAIRQTFDQPTTRLIDRESCTVSIPSGLPNQCAASVRVGNDCLERRGDSFPRTGMTTFHAPDFTSAIYGGETLPISMMPPPTSSQMLQYVWKTLTKYQAYDWVASEGSSTLTIEVSRFLVAANDKPAVDPVDIRTFLLTS
jgi:hypothetical protein